MRTKTLLYWRKRLKTVMSKGKKRKNSVCAPCPNSPPSTIMDFFRAEFEQTELRLANKIMTNLEGKYLEKANNEKVLIERLEREVDILKSEIQNKNNQISSMLRNMDNSTANFQNVEEENKGGACQNNARPCPDEAYEWRQVIPTRLGMNIPSPSMAKKASNEFDWIFHRCRRNLTCCHGWICLIQEIVFRKSSAKSQRPKKVAEENARAIHIGFESVSPKKKNHPRVIQHSKQSSTAPTGS